MYSYLSSMSPYNWDNNLFLSHLDGSIVYVVIMGLPLNIQGLLTLLQQKLNYQNLVRYYPKAKKWGFDFIK